MQRDLFDQPGARAQVGERQTDLEAEIERVTFEESLAGRIIAGDDAGADELARRAEAGQIIRIM